MRKAVQTTAVTLDFDDPTTRHEPRSGRWKKTLRLGLVAVVVVFLINLCLLIVSYGRLSVNDGVAVMYIRFMHTSQNHLHLVPSLHKYI